MRKTGFSLCSLLLVLTMLVNMLPVGVIAQEIQKIEATDTVTQVTAPTVTAETKVVQELVQERTESTKKFLLSNGLYMAAVYPEPVHYEKDGTWAEIDNTLTARTDGTYTNTAGVWNVSFPQQLTGAKSVIIEKDGYTLSFAMAGELRSSGELMTAAIGTESATEQLAVSQMQTASAAIEKTDLAAVRAKYTHGEMAPEKLYSRLTYGDVYPGTDIRYDLESNRVKESIILESYSSTLRGYRYTLNVGQLIPVLEDNGEITLYDKEKKNVVMVMPAPYLLDNAMEISNDVQVQLTGGKNGAYTLTYLLPTQWLAAAERAWPVILDPVVRADISTNNMQDRTVCENRTYAYTWSLFDAGRSDARGKIRSYLKYDELPPITSSDVVVGAQIKFYKAQSSGTEIPTELHKVTGGWNSEEITWANQPAFDNNASDYAIVKNEGWYVWEITDIVQSWYNEANNGLVMKLSDAIENGTEDKYRQFYSSDAGSAYHPVLFVFFRNNNGLESYWDYTATSAGRAGTGYVNNFTGNMVWTQADIGFDGNLMPVTINHIYNLNDAIVPNDSNNSNDSANTFGMGYGWRTNFNQLLYKWELDGEEQDYYIWEDADGTDHYFEYKDGAYRDEDNGDLILTTSGSGSTKYCIEDKNGNRSYFDTEGRFTKQSNNQATKSHITVTYAGSTSRNIAAITDGANRVYAFTYTNGLLSRISYKGSGSNEICGVSFSYENGCLKSITYQDGKSVTYGYSGKLLTSATDIDGYKIVYSYTTPQKSYQPYRVQSVCEYDGNTEGGRLTFAYGHNNTTITDHNGNKEIYQFNDFGNTVSIQDDEGRAQFAQYALNTDTAADNNTDATKRKNQLKLSSKLQNTVGNMLKDSSFEVASQWTANNSAITLSRTNETAYYGNYSLKMVSTITGTNVGAYSNAFTVEDGATVTFSAYIKNPDVPVTMAITYQSGNGDVSIKSSEIAANSQWTRYEHTFTNNTGGSPIFVVHIFASAPGTCYIDCVQAEKAETASRYNLVENGDFGSAARWTWSNLTSSDTRVTGTIAAPELENTVMKIIGEPDKAKKVTQEVVVSGSAKDTFVLAGWAKGDSAPLNSEETDAKIRSFCLKAIFNNTDGTKTERVVSFNPDTNSQNNWQYVAAPVIADKAYSSITVAAVYDYNINTAYFDGIQLFKEEFGSSYTYDEEGNVISVTDLQKQTTNYEYNTDNELTRIVQNNKAKMTYTYDDWHNVKTATSEEGLAYSFTYDDYGNNTEVKIDNLSSSATYTDDKNLLKTTTNALGKVTEYGYNINTSVLEWVQYPEDTEETRTEYTYDSMYRMATAACETDSNLQLSASYTYTNDNLTAIQTPSTTYSFGYGDFDQRTGVSIGNRTLATYTYTNDRNRYLQSRNYGNSDYVNYTYDDKGRLLTQTYEDGDTVSNRYDNSGNLAKVTDSATGRTTTYYYDFTDRVMKYVEKGTNYSHSVGYEYDLQNNLTQLVEEINGTKRTTSYTYDDDNRVTSVTTDGTTVEYTYDSYGRITQQVTKSGNTTIMTESFTYVNPTADTTSAQIATHTTTAGTYSVTYSYTYDDNGNITSISDGTNIVNYTYDSANQLIWEGNSFTGNASEWGYDDAGNITYEEEYTYNEQNEFVARGIREYEYDNEWGDLLTSYDGDWITYDAIGNPLDDTYWTYTWEHGRQLASMTKGATTWTYNYNADGLRTQKSNGTDTYDYVYNGSQLTQMTKGTDTLIFTYDASGTPLTVKYNGTIYYYATNIQSDVVAILNSSGNAVVSYSYNAWGVGKLRTGSMADTLGVLNPLRYRGYVYDQETGLYYLQSRYYDPEIGRFINADDIICTDASVVLHNLFSYCENNPVMGYDPAGHWNWGGFVAGVAIAAVGIAAIAATVATGGGAAPVAVVAAKIAITAIGIALTGTGVVTSYAAAAEKPMVIDVSSTNGSTHDKTGYSVVIDFDTDSVGIDTYYHYGKTTDGSNATYGVGLVTGYEKPGDYGGYFVDGGGSYSYQGINYGVDVCTDPSAPFSKCSAILGTVGVGFTEGTAPVYGGFDYYVPISYIEWG